MLLTELGTGEIPEVYRRFAEFVGEAHWRNRIKKIKEEIRGNRFLGEFLRSENALCFQLEHLRELQARFGSIPAWEVNNREIYPAMSFAAQVLSLAQVAPRPLSEQLRRRVHDALNKPEAMRALRLELSAATHFARRSRRLTWPEMTGGGTFDLLVEDVGPDGLEVECKSIGEDTGRKVHKREALDFYGLLRPHLQPTIKGLQTGLSAVLTLQGRLPERHGQRVDLARGFARAIFAGKSTSLQDGSGVRISEFDPAVLGDIPSGVQPSEVRATIDQVSETRNRQTMVVGTNAGGALALTLQSSKDDALMKAIFDTLSDSARRQFSGARGAMFLVGLHGLGGDQLFSVAQQDQDISQTPTALRIAVSRFLSGEGRDHVVGVGFLSESGLQPLEAGLVESGGTAYYFPKRESPEWSEDFSGLFTWNHPNAQLGADGLGRSP
jgi:hypothetical protein